MKVVVLSLFLFLNLAVSAQDAYVSVRRANLRDLASTEGKIVAKLQRNEQLELIEQVGVWWNVRAKGVEGWLHRSTFEFIKYATQQVPDTQNPNSPLPPTESTKTQDPRPLPPSSRYSDMQMKRKIEDKIARRGIRGVTVRVMNSQVILTGTVSSTVVMAQVFKIATESDPEKVINKLKLK